MGTNWPFGLHGRVVGGCDQENALVHSYLLSDRLGLNCSRFRGDVALVTKVVSPTVALVGLQSIAANPARTRRIFGTG